MKLNLGCGYDIRKGYENIDKYNPDVIVHDLDNPLPYPHNSVSEILIYDALEHINKPFFLLGECYRVLSSNGILKVKLPHFSCFSAYDPLHKTYWSAYYFRRFTYFERKGSMQQNKWFEIIYCKIHFFKGKLFWNIFIEKIVNINPKIQYLYESIFCWVFPSRFIEIHLKKI